MMPIPLCDVVERCGGCPWLAFGAADERAHKSHLVDVLLNNLGLAGIRADFFESPLRIGYRNRIRLRIDDQGRICFFNSEKSPHCAALRPELRQFVAQLLQWAAAHTGRLTSFAHLEARALDDLGRAGLLLTYHATAESNEPLIAELTEHFSPCIVSTDRHSQLAWQRFSVHDGTYSLVPLNGFIQINPAVNRILVDQVVQSVLDSNWGSFVDLYGGAGNFALPLAHAGLKGALVERNRDCVRAASQAALVQGISHLELHGGDAIEVGRRYLSENRAFDAIVVDPPRAGVRDGLQVVSALARGAIVYCSCNLESLERDLRELIAAGWSLHRLATFDMFPGTQHLEAVAWLTVDSR
jgi:23S rRNA (uracil1939-C5)-methyltransferase